MSIMYSITSKVSYFIANQNITIWFWFSIIEFIIILFLLIKQKKMKSDRLFFDLNKIKTENAKKSNIDMNKLMDSINNSKSLYKELSKKYHPDRFVNTSKHLLSERLFQEISKNKRNHENLILLKKQAESELGTNI